MERAAPSHNLRAVGLRTTSNLAHPGVPYECPTATQEGGILRLIADAVHAVMERFPRVVENRSPEENLVHRRVGLVEVKQIKPAATGTHPLLSFARSNPWAPLSATARRRPRALREPPQVVVCW